MTLLLVVEGGERPKRSESFPEKDALRLVGEEGGEFSLLDMAESEQAATNSRSYRLKGLVLFKQAVSEGCRVGGAEECLGDRSSMSLFLAYVTYVACVAYGFGVYAYLYSYERQLS